VAALLKAVGRSSVIRASHHENRLASMGQISQPRLSTEQSRNTNRECERQV